MKITRIDRAKIENPYAIDFFDCSGKPYAICASGSDGACAMFPLEGDGCSFQQWNPSNGGAQMFHQLDQDHFLVIQGFFPEFQCQGSYLALATREDGRHWKLEPCFFMPYLHKFAYIMVENQAFLLAATLSGPKIEKEDWSIPGQVLIAKVPDKLVGGNWQFTPLIEPMTKNHGFWQGSFNGHHTLLFSASEGLYAVKVPSRIGQVWAVEKLLPHEISDAAAFDLDGDGQDELVTINGFHGDELAVYDLSEDGYQQVFSYHLDYIHTVWAGKLFDFPYLIAGELFGEAKLVFLEKSESGWNFTPQFSFDQIGPFSVKVRQNSKNGYDVLCPARTAGQAIVFSVSP